MGVFQKGTITGHIFLNILNRHWENIDKDTEEKVNNTNLYNIHQ